MDPHFLVTREEFQDVQMDLKRIHTIQQHHSDRLRMLEKRQADDAQLRSVWNSPFPSVLGGTPQHGKLCKAQRPRPPADPSLSLLIASCSLKRPIAYFLTY